MRLPAQVRGGSLNFELWMKNFKLKHRMSSRRELVVGVREAAVVLIEMQVQEISPFFKGG